MSAKKSISHDIDRDAKSTLLSHTGGWATSTPEEDIGIDYIFELFDNYVGGTADATGIDFGVQLKGALKLKISETTVRSPSIGTDMLLYAVEKRRRPTFVVAVDVGTRRGFWIDLNLIAVPKVIGKWRKQKTASFAIPLENEICDSKKWQSAILDADKKSRDKWSTDPVQAIKFKKQKFERDNPGLRAELMATEKGISYKCYSDKPIKGTLTFKSKSGGAQKFLEQLFDHGAELNPADFGIEIEQTGFPMLESSFLNGKFAAIQVSNRTPASVRLIVVDSSARECGGIELYGVFVGGLKYRVFNSSIADGAFAIQLGLNPAGVTVNLNFSTSPWVEKNICKCRDFDRLSRFLSKIDVNNKVICEISMDGNSVVKQTIESACSELQEFAEVVDFLSRVKKIAKDLRIDFVLPKKSTPTDLSELEYIEEFLSGKAVSATANDVSVTCSLNAGTLSELKGAPGRLVGIKASLPEPSFKAALLGVTLDLGPAVIHIPPTDFEYEILNQNSSSPEIRIFSEKPIESIAERVQSTTNK